MYECVFVILVNLRDRWDFVLIFRILCYCVENRSFFIWCVIMGVFLLGRLGMRVGYFFVWGLWLCVKVFWGLRLVGCAILYMFLLRGVFMKVYRVFGFCLCVFERLFGVSRRCSRVKLNLFLGLWWVFLCVFL